MIFYLTAPDYLALERTDVPLFVNHYALFGGRVQRLPRARGPWCLDSGGYTQLRKKQNRGRWPFTAEQYVRDVRLCVERIGNLQWAAIMDWMTEDEVLQATGLDVLEHQYRTIDSYLELRSLGGPSMAHLWLPVLQGRCPEDYRRHLAMYMNEGIDLRQADWVGVGSVCRLGNENRIAQVFGELNSLGLTRLHAFGLKMTGLQWDDVEMTTGDPDLNELYRVSFEAGMDLADLEARLPGILGQTRWDQVETSVCHLIRSSDSNAWSERAKQHGNGVYGARNAAFGHNQWVAYKGSLWRYAGPQPAPSSNKKRLVASGWKESWSRGRLRSKTEPVLGELLGRIKHEQAWPEFPRGGPENDPFTPTQMRTECSLNREAKDNGHARVPVERGAPDGHERCVSDLAWGLIWRDQLRQAVEPLGCWHEFSQPQFRTLPTAPYYPPEQRAADAVERMKMLGLWPPPSPEELRRRGYVEPPGLPPLRGRRLPPPPDTPPPPPPPSGPSGPTSGPQLTLWNPRRAAR